MHPCIHACMCECEYVWGRGGVYFINEVIHYYMCQELSYTLLGKAPQKFLLLSILFYFLSLNLSKQNLFYDCPTTVALSNYNVFEFPRCSSVLFMEL